MHISGVPLMAKAGSALVPRYGGQRATRSGRYIPQADLITHRQTTAPGRLASITRSTEDEPPIRFAWVSVRPSVVSHPMPTMDIRLAHSIT